METTIEAPKKNTTRTIVVRVILGLLLAVGLIYGYNVWNNSRHHETTDNAQIETYVVPVLPRVSGYVKSVNVQDYSSIKKGQLLLEIDNAEYQMGLDELNANYQQALADVENAKANIVNTQLSYRTSLSNQELTGIRREKAKADFERDDKLFNDKAITKKQYDDTKNNYDVAINQYGTSNSDAAVSKSRINVSQSLLLKAEAALKQIQSKIDQQKLKLDYTKVIATQSGKIGKKNAEPGQFVQAGQPLMSIVNDSLFWIIANFKETQIGKMKLGDVVEIKLDSYPNLDLKGKISSFSDATGARFSLLPPDNASGNFVKVTQRVPVKIEILDEAKYKDILRAGLSAEISVEIK